MRTKKLYLSSASLLVLALWMVFAVQPCSSQSTIAVPERAEGPYWLVSPKPWFTRLLAISTNNRELPKEDHDESLPTLPGYYHRAKEGQPFVRYPFTSIVVRRGKATFTTRLVEGHQFVFRGSWGTEYERSSGIEDVPFLKGTLLTYRKGRLVKKELVKFSHAVNA